MSTVWWWVVGAVVISGIVSLVTSYLARDISIKSVWDLIEQIKTINECSDEEVFAALVELRDEASKAIDRVRGAK